MHEGDNPYTPPRAGSDEPHQLVPSATRVQPRDEDPFAATEPPALAGWTVPHRGGSILGLAICGFALCFICGLVAWILGAKDLKQMDQGVRDPAGRGVTKAGMIVGVVSTFLAGLIQILYAVAIISGV